jgi:glycosyltransferase involved in cell wall biosynthesis
MPKVGGPRKILFLHASDEMYGSDKVMLWLLERIDRGLLSPTVILPKDVPPNGPLSAALRERGIPVIHMHLAVLRRRYSKPIPFALYLLKIAYSTLRIAGIIVARRFDVVQTNTAAVLPGAFAAKLTARPHIWHVHETIVQPRRVAALIAWLLPRFSYRVIAVSQAVKANLSGLEPKNLEKCAVIYNGLDPSGFGDTSSRESIRSAWGVGPGEILVGMLGRISVPKGQIFLIEAARKAAAENPRLRFVLVGGPIPGNENQLEDLLARVRSYGLSDRIRFEGFRPDIGPVLSAFDIFVLPSVWPDSFPTVVLEAMAARKPVIATGTGGSVEMIDEGKTGYIVSHLDPGPMATRILELAADPAKARAMGENGYVRLTSLFTMGAFERRWNDLYRELLGA